MLTRLDGILLGGQAVGIIAHGVQNVKTLLAFVARIDIAGDVAQRMAHMQARSRRIWEHVEHVEFLLLLVFYYAIGAVLDPSLLPFFLNVSEIILHKIEKSYFFYEFDCKINRKKRNDKIYSVNSTCDACTGEMNSIKKS